MSKENRTIIVGVRVTPSQYAELLARSAREGEKVAGYCYKRISAHLDRVKPLGERAGKSPRSAASA